MLVLELGKVVYIAINNDPEVICLVVTGDVSLGECFGHVGGYGGVWM